MHSEYEVVGINNEIVFIEDVGHKTNRSVTNDAEAVIVDVIKKYGNKRVVYKDSQGEWGELTHDGEDFTGFAPYTPSFTPKREW